MTESPAGSGSSEAKIAARRASAAAGIGRATALRLAEKAPRSSSSYASMRRASPRRNGRSRRLAGRPRAIAADVTVKRCKALFASALSAHGPARHPGQRRRRGGTSGHISLGVPRSQRGLGFHHHAPRPALRPSWWHRARPLLRMRERRSGGRSWIGRGQARAQEHRRGRLTARKATRPVRAAHGRRDPRVYPPSRASNLPRHGVAVNAVAPGPIGKPSGPDLVPRDRCAADTGRSAPRQLRRIGVPADIANAVGSILLHG